jgi:TonB family protein
MTSRRWTVSWLFAASASAFLTGCGVGGPEAQNANTSVASTSPYEFRDTTCSLKQGDASETTYDQGLVQQELDRIAPAARECEPAESETAWSIELFWGANGCVRAVTVTGERPDPSVGSCIVEQYRKATIARVGGSGALAFVSGRGAILELSRIGTLEAEVIQSVIHAEYAQFRLCYEDGLRRNRGLSGRVSARFAIDESGAVTRVSNAGSDLPDSAVVSCVLRAFTTLRFPAPVGGTVTVVYPVTFQP